MLLQFACPAELFAQPTRSAVRICTQNIHRYGDPSKHAKTETRLRQRDYLVERFIRARCDVIALQEVSGEREEQSLAILRELTNALQTQSQRTFLAAVGKSNDRFIRNAFLVDVDFAKITDIKSFNRQPLPRLQPGSGPSNRFTRGPVRLLLELPPLAPGGPVRRLAILNEHFKSRSFPQKDPTQTKFEALRLEMAEALRDIALHESAALETQDALVVLGDRNSEADSGSADVLTGARELEDFSEGRCRLDKQLRAQCAEQAPRTRQLIGLFAERGRRFPGRFSGGSYRYKKKEIFMDEILVRPRDLQLVLRGAGSFSIGLEGDFGRGSDHRLLWAELDWARAAKGKH